MELHLLNAGGTNRGKLEAVADVLMTPVSKLLLGRSVKYTPETGFSREKETIPFRNKEDVRSEEVNVMGAASVIILSPIILAIGILISVPCAIGLGLKKIAMNLDKKSETYQQAVKAYLHYEKAFLNKDKMLNSINILQIDKNIEEAEKIDLEAIKKNNILPLKSRLNLEDLEPNSEPIQKIATILFNEHQKKLEKMKKRKEIILKNNEKLINDTDEKIRVAQVNLQKITEEYAK